MRWFKWDTITINFPPFLQRGTTYGTSCLLLWTMNQFQIEICSKRRESAPRGSYCFLNITALWWYIFKSVSRTGPLPANLALWACHGLSSAVGLPFLTFVIPVELLQWGLLPSLVVRSWPVCRAVQVGHGLTSADDSRLWRLSWSHWYYWH